MDLHSKIAAALSAVAFLLVAVAVAAPQSAESSHADDYVWDLPKGFPKPKVPADNPMTVAKVRLGRYLFYDQRMSVNGKQSCADCHRQELAFTDGKAQAVGATGELHPRGSMSLVNVAYDSVLTWSNPDHHDLEGQMVVPMFGQHPVELGLLNQGSDFLKVVKSDPFYRALFPQVFSEEADPFTIANVVKAIASFERTIISARSPYDRYHYGGDDSAVSDSAKRGEILFFSQPLSCFRCHGGFNFSDATDFEGSRERDQQGPAQFHNTGLYNVAGPLSYPQPNVGIYEHTGRPEDVGKFKAPTLRNIALTAPYMHDGSIATLEAVLDHYAAGGRTIAGGPLAGEGSRNPNKDPLIRGFSLSPQDRADLVEFLRSLTDEELIHDPRFANPWVEQKENGPDR